MTVTANQCIEDPRVQISISLIYMLPLFVSLSSLVYLVKHPLYRQVGHVIYLIFEGIEKNYLLHVANRNNITWSA